MRKGITIFNPSSIFSDDFVNNVMNNTGFDFQYTNELEMYEDENNVVVRLKAPGYKSNEVDISIEDSVLTITGESKSEVEEEDKKKKYYYKEMQHGSFTRSVNLPVHVKADDAEAEFKDGIIHITLPKSEEVKAKKVKVKKN